MAIIEDHVYQTASVFLQEVTDAFASMLDTNLISKPLVEASQTVNVDETVVI